jgi:uncharacterized membrane protein YkoI
LVLAASTALGQSETSKQLPAAVAKVVRDNKPGAEIDKMTIEKEAGVTLYDFEFKAGKGEMDVAEDGTVLDIATIVEMREVDKAASEVILKAAEGARIMQLSKSEVRAEIKKEGQQGKVVKLAAPRYVYEAELQKGNQVGEIEVDPDGKVIEALKWRAKGSKEEE